jgi:hypothetical protein
MLTKSLKRELKTTVVASNPSIPGLRSASHTYHIAGFGKLLAEWPALTEK